MHELSFTALKIVKAFVTDPDKSWHGYGLIYSASISKQAAYPILRRFLEQGWLSDAGMQISTCKMRTDGTATRKTYRVTDLGLSEGKAALRELQLPSSI